MRLHVEHENSFVEPVDKRDDFKVTRLFGIGPTSIDFKSRIT